MQLLKMIIMKPMLQHGKCLQVHGKWQKLNVRLQIHCNYSNVKNNTRMRLRPGKQCGIENNLL